jgi:hypothetical protein
MLICGFQETDISPSGRIKGRQKKAEARRNLFIICSKELVLLKNHVHRWHVLLIKYVINSRVQVQRVQTRNTHVRRFAVRPAPGAWQKSYCARRMIQEPKDEAGGRSA